MWILHKYSSFLRVAHPLGPEPRLKPCEAQAQRHSGVCRKILLLKNRTTLDRSHFGVISTSNLTLNRFYSSPGPPSVAFTEALGSGNKFARVRAVHTKKTIRRRQLINAPQNTDPCQLLRPVEIRTGRTCSTGCNLVTFAAFLSHFWSSNFRDGRALPFLVAPCSDLGS